MRILLLPALLLCLGCSQVASSRAVDEARVELEVVRSELLNALDLTPENTTKIETLERIYNEARRDWANRLENYLDRAEELREKTWDGWKTAALWAERVGMLAILLPMI